MKSLVFATVLFSGLVCLSACENLKLNDMVFSDGDIEIAEEEAPESEGDIDTVPDGDVDVDSAEPDSEINGETAEEAENAENGELSEEADTVEQGETEDAAELDEETEQIQESDSSDSVETAEESDTAESSEIEESDAESLTENDAEAEIIESEDESDAVMEECPSDMVQINNYCIDRYEASRPDATADDIGDDESQATSRMGVLPWNVNPMNSTHLGEFEDACEAAGKRLCTADEWFESCNGADNSTYVWGNSFDAETCNCVDTYCDDYCAANGISLENCNTAANCGYACGASSRVSCFHVAPTGSFNDCTNDYGAYDINGNVWEIVPVATNIDSRGYMVRGGAYNCANAPERLECDFNAGWDALYAGFRCCKSLDKSRDVK